MTAAIAVPWVASRRPTPQLIKAEADVRAIYAASLEYRADRGEWPTSVRNIYDWWKESLPVVGLGPCGGDEDPWGHEYQFMIDDDRLSIVCFGQDGFPGGQGENADIAFDGIDP